MPFPKDSEFVCLPQWDESIYQEILSWVDDRRRAAIISANGRISPDPRVKIYPFDSPLQFTSIARNIAWSAVLRKLHIVGEGEWKEEIERSHLAADLILSEAADYWVSPMKNAWANQGLYRRGLELEGAFANIPALIVGAGPSLEKNRHLLRYFENKALIFAGGTALNGIDAPPHFGGAIDAEAPYRQFKRHPFVEIPFCYQSRMNRDNFSLLHGEKLLFPDSASDAVNWLSGENKWNGGWTVGNFLTAAAVHMGCSPIFFVGMDFCYEQGKKYGGIEDSAPVQKGIETERGVTQRDWLMAARWTEEMGEGRHWINATEGGLLRLPKKDLSDVLSDCPDRGNLRALVHRKIQLLPFYSNEQKRNEWALSLKRCRMKSDDRDQEVVYIHLLEPLWQIWRPVFEREIGLYPEQKLELHRELFFQTVLEEHGSFIL